MRADGLQLIELGDGRIVLRRGIAKVVFDQVEVAPIVGRLLDLLDGSRSRDEVIAAFPDTLRPDVEQLLDGLVARRLVDETSSTAAPADSAAAAFFASFGLELDAVYADLRAAKVAVCGDNLVARAVLRNLASHGLGHAMLVPIPVLDNEFVEPGDVAARSETALGEVDLASVDILCATCDLGEPDALLELNRLALRHGTVFLPAWVSDLVGFVGPLTHPFETACFRCYRLRADSNDPDYVLRGEIRRAATESPVGRLSAGFLPAMADVVGAIAAMEILKAIVPFMPSDAVGRLIEINLVSFASSVRRVLKLPRCPDCGEVQRVPQVVLEHGPQIPY